MDGISDIVRYSIVEQCLQETLEEQLTDDLLAGDVNVHDVRARILSHTGSKMADEDDIIPDWFDERVERFMDEFNDRYGEPVGNPEVDEEGNVVGEPEMDYPFETKEEAVEYLLDQGLVSYFLDERVGGVPIKNDNRRCPDCGNEDTEKMRGFHEQRVARDHEINSIRKQPPATIKCMVCQNKDGGYRFKQAYEVDRMSEEERQKMKKQQEKAEGEMVGWQESADYQAKQRERNARNRRR